MIRYFQLSDIKEVSGQCPLYGNCQTGKVLPPEYCARYKCNTFYQIDTIKFFLDGPWGPNFKGNSTVEEIKESTGIAKIVEQHLSGKNGNENGHSNGNGSKGKPSKVRSCV